MPSVLRVSGTTLNEPAPPPKILLAFGGVRATAAEDDHYWLSIAEAQEVASWLTTAARDLDDAVTNHGDLAVVREIYDSVNELDREHLIVHGMRLEHDDECGEVGIVVDVAVGLEGSASRVRLVFVDDVVAYSLHVERARELAHALIAACEQLRDDLPVVVRNRVANHLVQEARRDRLVLLIGAGISKDAGLPLWGVLVAPFATRWPTPMLFTPSMSPSVMPRPTVGSRS